MNQEEANEKILEIMNKDEFLSKEEIQLFKELIYQCDLTKQNNNGYTQLMYALSYNKYKNLNLSEEQIDYLIKNSDLTQKNRYGYTPLLYVLYFNKTENLQLTSQQFKTLYDAVNEKEQQDTFKNIIYENKKNHQYLEEIKLLLYDFKFKPNTKTINYLKENKYQDILEMIEKRNVYFQLNQEIRSIENAKKITKIKI